MPSNDVEEIMGQLAEQYGCSDGTCGYDFDDECYWWLQGKVQAEIEQREREKHAWADQARARATNWTKTDPDEFLRIIQKFVTNLALETDTPIWRMNAVHEGVVKSYTFPDRWQSQVTIMQVIPSQWDDPFADGINQRVQQRVVADCGVECHGGPVDNTVVHVEGHVPITRRFAYVPPMEQPWYMKDMNATVASTIRIANYRLVMIDNQPHYFYDPEV